MPDLTDEQLAEIKRLDAERTQGEWKPYVVVETDGNFYFVINANKSVIADTDESADAKYIAACSWAIPALIREVEQLRHTNALLKQMMTE